MARRDLVLRSEPGFALPAFERIAPAPPLDLLGGWIEEASSPGDVVLDLNSRGGWVGRAAIDRQRRAIVVESNPLTRLLAEVVLRPPDLRHLDAAFQAISAAPRGQSSLKVSIGDTFATRCPRCGRTVPADEFIWETSPEDGTARLLRKYYRCLTCRDQAGGSEGRHAEVDEADVERTAQVDPRGPAWRAMRERFAPLDDDAALVDDLLLLHTPRQLAGLQAILERVEADLRAAPVEAALRLSLVQAILPASRLNGFPGRVSSVRIAGGRLRQPSSREWRERNPWLAFEDGFRLVRGFVQRLEASAPGPIQARFGEDVRSLAEGAVTAVVRVATPTGLRTLAGEGAALRRRADRPHVRLVLGEPPPRPTQERLSYAYLATCWALGRDAASLLPLDALSLPGGRVPWSWQAAALRHGLAAADSLLERDGRVVLIVEPGPEALIAGALGGVGAGYRLIAARLGQAGDDHGSVELVPPGSTLPGGPRTRANVPLPPVAGGPGDPDLVSGRGVFAPPERYDARPLTAADVGATVTDTAVAVLQARGEPASYEGLLGEILVGLDRSNLLRRLVALGPPEAAGVAEEGQTTLFFGPPPAESAGEEVPGRPDADDGRSEPQRRAGPEARSGSVRAGETVLERARRRGREPLVASEEDPVEGLLELIRRELVGPDQRRLEEVEPGRWWLARREDRAAAATPLADRVEWAVFSLLSTAGSLPEASFFDRVARLFEGDEGVDESLVRACLESYRSRASTSEDLQTTDDLLRRSAEHGELIAMLADLGHRLGLSVWIARREQERRVRGRPLVDWLDGRERNVHLPLITRAAQEDLEEVDCIWYARRKLVMTFEVEWTAMLSEPVLRRHAAIPDSEELVRFLVIAPERTELVRFKLARSPLLRAALAAGNWHVLKSNHLRAFAALESPALADLEPLLGLDAPADRGGEQLALFG